MNNRKIIMIKLQKILYLENYKSHLSNKINLKNQ